MPWNGSGVFTRLFSWVNDKNAGIDITASRMDSDTNDIVTGLENTVTLDGQTVPTANLPMGGFIHTGVGNATARSNYVAAGQVIDSTLVWGGTSGGSANAQTIAITPTVTALVTGQTFAFLAGFTNTGAATLTVNATAATAIRKLGLSGPVALVASDIVAGNTYRVTYDGTSFTLVSPTFNPVIATGSWTPTDGSGAGLTFTSVSASYYRIGSLVFIYGTLTYPATADGSQATIAGLPVAVVNQDYAFDPIFTTVASLNTVYFVAQKGASTMKAILGSTGAAFTNAGMTTNLVRFSGFYACV